MISIASEDVINYVFCWFITSTIRTTDTESRDSENIYPNISWVCLLAGGLLTAFNGFFFDRNKILIEFRGSKHSLWRKVGNAARALHSSLSMTSMADHVD